MNPGILLVLAPLAAGLIALVLPRFLARWFALLVALVAFVGAVSMFTGKDFVELQARGINFLVTDSFSNLIILGVTFFGLLMTLYSMGFIKRDSVRESSYYGNILLAIGAGCGVAAAGNVVLLAVFWGFLSLPLYLLINMGGEGCRDAAKKTLLIAGATDSILLLGLVCFRLSMASFNVPETPWAITGIIGWTAVIALIIAAFAKAGAMPFHSWVPDAAQSAPTPVVALLPASIDKLLGIYLLARVFNTYFAIPHGLQVACLLIGAATVVFAVMAAMVQHNLRRLLGFHAVSQVGYMVIGVATMNPIGLLGGLFHMVNHAIYKSCLFLTAGAAERRTGETELDKMGGLAKIMPVTFIASTIAAFSISGIPPFNGFASKWMIYNGILQSQAKVGWVWILVLVAAMFGSALTLASFVKMLHSVFLGQPKKREHEGRSPNFAMGLPMVTLALLCVVLGVGAISISVKYLFLDVPGVKGVAPDAIGLWQARTATVLLFAALLVGGVIYLFSTFLKTRQVETFVGGEVGARAEGYQFEGVEFYRTIRELPLLKPLYEHAEQKWYDLYEVLRGLALYCTRFGRQWHSGLLYSYATWTIAGMLLILWFLLSAYKVF